MGPGSKCRSIVHRVYSLDSFPVDLWPTGLGHTSTDYVAGRRSLDFGCSRSRPLDMGTGKPAFVSRCSNRLLLGLRGPSPQGMVYRLTPEVRLFGEYRWDPRYLCTHLACLGSGPAPGPHIKKALSHTLTQGDTKQIPEPKSSTSSHANKLNLLASPLPDKTWTIFLYYLHANLDPFIRKHLHCSSKIRLFLRPHKQLNRLDIILSWLNMKISLALNTFL